MNKTEERLRSWSVTCLHVVGLAAAVTGTYLLCRGVPNVLALQKAQAVNLLADAHRAASLAKTYDARAAVTAMKTLQGSLNGTINNLT
jgi:hypothetical protein